MMNLAHRNRIIDNSQNVLLRWLIQFSEWGIRRYMRNNKERIMSQLVESIGYTPSEAELFKYSTLERRNQGEHYQIWFRWKGEYKFEVKV